MPFRAWGLKVRELCRFSTKQPQIDNTNTHREYPTKKVYMDLQWEIKISLVLG
jgi:hypothetical protein